MKKFAILGLALVALASCKPTEEQKQRLNETLPDGCVVHDIGSYGSINRMVIVVCDGRNVTSTATTESRSNGRTTSTFTSATFVIN